MIDAKEMAVLQQAQADYRNERRDKPPAAPVALNVAASGARVSADEGGLTINVEPQGGSNTGVAPDSTRGAEVLISLNISGSLRPYYVTARPA